MNKFNYNIDKKRFVKSINALKELNSLYNDLYSLGIDVTNCNKLSDIESEFTNLLCECCNDTNDNDTITYFMYDLNFGKDYYDGCITDNGNNINLSTIDKLWEYIENNNLKEDKK